MDSKNISNPWASDKTGDSYYGIEENSAKGQSESSSADDGHNVISNNLRWAMKMRRRWVCI